MSRVLGRLGWVVAVALVAALSTLARPPEAQAFVTPPQSTQAGWDATWKVITGQRSMPLGATTNAQLQVGRSMTSAGLLTGSNLTLAFVALGAGYLIGSGIDSYFHISCNIASTCTQATTPSGANKVGVGSTGAWSTTATTAGLCGGSTGYYCLNIFIAAVQSAFCCFAASTGNATGWPIGGTDPLRDVLVAWVNAFTGLPGGYADSGGTQVWRATPAEIAASLRLDTGPIPKGTRSGTALTPPAQPLWGSAAQIAATADLMGGDAATDEEIGRIISPEAYAAEDLLETGTITLPPPDANETVVAYRQRLREMGWLGTATTAAQVNDSSSPLWGPLQVRSIKIRPATATEAVQVMPGWAPVGYAGPSPTDWPENPPQFGPNDAIEFTPNTSTATPVDTSTATPPGGIAPGGGGCDPWLDADFDLAPLMGVELGDKFPFGVFVWAEDWLDSVNASPDAPSWSFSTPSLAGQTLPSYDIDLDWADSYMSTFRSIVSWALWVGAVWFLASSMLGLRLGGDPADAVDDVL